MVSKYRNGNPGIILIYIYIYILGLLKARGIEFHPTEPDREFFNNCYGMFTLYGMLNIHGYPLFLIETYLPFTLYIDMKTTT